MPDHAADVVRAGAVARLGRVAADAVHPRVDLAKVEALGPEAGADEEEEAGRDDEEGVQGKGRAAAVDEEADNEAGDYAADDGKGRGLGGLRDRDLRRGKRGGRRVQLTSTLSATKKRADVHRRQRRRPRDPRGGP